MNFAIYGRTISPAFLPFIQQLVSKIEESGCSITVFEPFYQLIFPMTTFLTTPKLFNDGDKMVNETDLLISIGGDGTLLGTIMLLRNSGIPVIGVNIGKLGFLSSVSREDVSSAIEEILLGKYRIDQRSLLKLEMDNNPFGDVNFALNDFTIYKQNPNSMMAVKTWVNKEFLNAYWGDGLIVSTPTGSTGYSMSCGGPIILPGSDNFVITPIATHNLTVRPIVIPDTCEILIRVEGEDTRFFAGLDSRSYGFTGTTEFQIKQESYKIKLLQLENQSFFKTIRAKLNWGLDARN
jgi:NAD+ kinase